MASSNNPGNKRPPILRYSGLGLQIALIIGGSAWLGSWLDEKYPQDKKWFTLALVLLGVSLAMAYAIRVLNRINK